MKIFKPKQIPNKAKRRVAWDLKEGWAIEIEGQVLYGARTKESLEKALLPQPGKPFKKSLKYYYM